MVAERPTKVAVIGGGCAALTTAFELTRPEHRGRFEVTVYQMGWRLGGKGASGRGPADRIEEHGLHIWMGFYENAFRLMRAAYGELGRDKSKHRIAEWRDAFAPAPVIGVTNRAAGGGWEPWVAHFPPSRGLPGDADADAGSITVRGYLERAVMLLVELLRSAAKRVDGSAASDDGLGGIGKIGADDVVGAVERVVRYGQLATVAAIVEAAELLRSALETVLASSVTEPGMVLALVDAITAAARRQLEMLVGGDAELGRIWEVVDTILAIVRGTIRFNLVFDPRGFDAIDAYDYREWLRQNGASERTLASGFIRGIYDLVFAYADGDPERPSLSAAVALRGAMRMFFTYRGAMFWRMSAGMGDIVFAPLYEVLEKRGVKFELFHRLSSVHLAQGKELEPGERPYVKALAFDVQAETVRGRPYRPLVEIHGVPCWPSKPDYRQLVGGAKLEKDGVDFESPHERRIVREKVLEVGVDFDLVVLGVAIGALPTVAKELVEAEPKWRAMVDQVKTVATQAFQVWTKDGVAELGWTEPNVSLSGYVEPFDTWADMSHLLPEESWSGRAKGVGYFCSVLADAPHPDSVDRRVLEKERARVRRHAVEFLEKDAKLLWPNAFEDDGRFRWDSLVSPEAEPKEARRRKKGEARFDDQYWTANVRPSDLYTLSLPGTSHYRLSPLDMSFDNLTIAGDWTLSGLNSGCVESAVMSGLLAAHALSGAPALEEIVGYDHP